MALKKKNIEVRKFEEGQTVKGFLLSAEVVEMAPYLPGQAPGHVPKLVLMDEKGDKFSVLLGSAMAEDVKHLTLGEWTEVTKGKAQKGKRGQFNPYTLAQDDEKTVATWEAAQARK